MNIKRVALQLSEQDILSIIKDFVDVKGLNIEEIKISDKIYIEGSYKILTGISFKIAVVLSGIKDNIALLTIDSITFGKIGLFKWIKNIALKMLSKSLKDLGIEYLGGTVFININRILKQIPFSVRFNIIAANIKDKLLNVTIEDICFFLKREALAGNNAVAIIRDGVEVKNDSKEEVSIEKVEDGYTKVREKVEEKLPDKYTELLDYLMIMPDVAALFFRLFKDKRVPIKTKVAVGGIATYLISPVDIMPDFIPFIGKIDDLALAFYALEKIINEVPENIIIENWQGREDIIIKAKEGIEFLNRAAGGTNVGKLIQFLRKLTSKRNEKYSKVSSETEVRE